jgi:DNA-binding transcriptional ArsR family regulator
MKTEPTQKELTIKARELKNAALELRAINHRLRQQMLHLIHKNGKVTVTNLFTALHLEQSVTSQHLGVLRKARLVNTQREGHFVFYSVNYNRLKVLHQLSEAILKPPVRKD